MIAAKKSQVGVVLSRESNMKKSLKGRRMNAYPRNWPDVPKELVNVSDGPSLLEIFLDKLITDVFANAKEGHQITKLDVINALKQKQSE
jgi:hypothetical protein